MSLGQRDSANMRPDSRATKELYGGIITMTGIIKHVFGMHILPPKITAPRRCCRRGRPWSSGSRTRRRRGRPGCSSPRAHGRGPERGQHGVREEGGELRRPRQPVVNVFRLLPFSLLRTAQLPSLNRKVPAYCTERATLESHTILMHKVPWLGAKLLRGCIDFGFSGSGYPPCLPNPSKKGHF